jgi:glycosyltransferase involved in cell wall biosynthesis
MLEFRQNLQKNSLDVGTTKDDSHLVVGIDASRNRSGGARAHIQGILYHFDAEQGVKTVHLWAYQALLDEIADRPWLVKHHHRLLERSLPFQLVWQAAFLKRAALRAECDILFATDATSLCLYRPLVVLSQDLLSYEPGVMQSYPHGYAHLRLQAIKIIQNLAFRRSRGVLFLTQYAADLIQQSCGRLSHTAIAPHGIDEAFRRINRPDPSDAPEGAERPIRCIYVSNADLYKHQWHVVEAIRLLRNRGYVAKLKLVGGGSGLAQKKLVDAMRRCDPAGQFVTQLNFVRHTDLPPLLAQADIYIFASSCENLPVILLEGMAAGLPIACSDRGPMPEVLQDGGVYFDPEHSDSIAAAVQSLIDSAELRAQVARKARQLALKYTWKNCSRDTFAFLRGCCLTSGLDSKIRTPEQEKGLDFCSGQDGP